MKIKELDNSKKKNKLSEAVKGTWRPGVFFKPKIRIPISKPRISKPKISDIETNWDFKPEPIATPPLTLDPGTPPAVTVSSLAHKPLEYPKLASVTDTVPDWKPSNFPAPVYDPGVVGGKLPEPDWSDRPEPELERPDPAGSKWGAKGQGIGTGPNFPPLPPPWKDREPHAYPVPFAKDPVFKKPELEPKITRDEPLPVPKDLPEPRLDQGPVGGPVPGRLPHRRPYTDEIAPLHPPEGLDKDPSEEPLGGEKPHPMKYDDLSDKEKKVFWRVLAPGVVPTAEMLEVHPHKWEEIIPVTDADKKNLKDTEPKNIQDTSTLAPANPEKGVDARDFWEGLGYSSLAQFEKAQKDGGGGKIGYAKGKTTGKQVPVVYPKQAYISKQAIDAGLTIGPKGKLVTTPKTVPTGKADKTTKPEEFNLNNLTFAKDSALQQIRQQGDQAGGTKQINIPVPSLSAETRIQMKKQLDSIIFAPTNEQKKVVADIEKNFKDLTPKDKTAIAVHMKSTIENYIKPNDQDLYHFGKNLHLSGNEIAAYTGGTVVATAALFYLVPAAIGTAFWTSLSTAARIALTSAVQALRSKGALKFATQTVKNL